MSTQVDAGPQLISGSNPIWYIRDTWLLTKRSVWHIIRSLDQVMGLVMFPVMFTILNRYVLGGAIEGELGEGITYADYVFAGVFVQTLAFGANYTTINLAVDLKEGIVDRFRSLPMSNSALIVGHIIADLFRNIISGTIIIVVALLIGFRPTADYFGWISIIAIGTLFSLAISSMSAVMGLMVKTLEAAQWMGFVIIFPLTFISSAFVPTETMPSWLQAFAVNQPLSQVMNYVRSVTVGDPAGNSLQMSIIWCVGIMVVSLPLTGWMFRRRSNK